jgi:uncharacterized protein (DUF111 family)
LRSNAHHQLDESGMSNRVVVIRTPSGISGDMLVAGLSKLAQVDDTGLGEILAAIRLPQIAGSVQVVAHQVDGIAGWRAKVDLPDEHAHRALKDIDAIIAQSDLTAAAKALSAKTFAYLAEVEGAIHGISPAAVTFHEVGALDSILDICVAAALIDKIGPKAIYCSPLPVCDGTVACAHGRLATPAPAVLEMLRGIPVYGIESTGETVTPTALAFLRSAGAHFGLWPEVTVEDVARAYGGRHLPNVPNGAMFVLCRRDKKSERTTREHPVFTVPVGQSAPLITLPRR